MSGIMDAGYQSIKNLGGQQTNQVGQSGARTTTVKLNGTEDLGGGMSANFQFEVQPSSLLRTATSSTLLTHQFQLVQLLRQPEVSTWVFLLTVTSKVQAQPLLNLVWLAKVTASLV